MAILLPTLPRGASCAPRLVEFGSPLGSPLGGPTQELSRLGDRMAFDVTLPALNKDQEAANLWFSRRMQAKAEGQRLRLVVPQHGDGAAVAACEAVEGAGTELTKTGGAGIAVGMWFSFVVGGRSYLHMVTSIAGDDLGVAPALRADPAGQDLFFDMPTIEGFIDGVAWTIDRLLQVGQSFALTEDR